MGNSAYLDSRLPVPIISNPGVIFYKDLIAGNTLDEQLKLAARAVSGLLVFKDKLDNKRLPVEKSADGEPMDMSQYGKILNSCRVPGSRRDKTVSYSSEKPRHIVVAHNNHFFTFDVIGSDGQLLNRKQIYDQLNAIVERSSYPWSSPLGIMTSENRSVWGHLYEKLSKNRENRRLFEIINKAIFMLCLDHGLLVSWPGEQQGWWTTPNRTSTFGPPKCFMVVEVASTVGIGGLTKRCN